MGTRCYLSHLRVKMSKEEMTSKLPDNGVTMQLAPQADLALIKLCMSRR